MKQKKTGIFIAGFREIYLADELNRTLRKALRN